MSTPPAVPAQGPRPVPPEVLDELLGYALQTVPGKALWRGYLLGADLPRGNGKLEATGTYTPEPPDSGGAGGAARG